jgi:hypothetical protein
MFYLYIKLTIFLNLLNIKTNMVLLFKEKVESISGLGRGSDQGSLGGKKKCGHKSLST